VVTLRAFETTRPCDPSSPREGCRLHVATSGRYEHACRLAGRQGRNPSSSRLICCAAVARAKMTLLKLRLQIPATALTGSGMRVDAAGLQVGMPQGGRDERDWRPIIDGMSCVRESEPVDRRGRVDASALGGLFEMKLTARWVSRLPGRRTD
jgi:hypothetical protein